jgi:hypothetical protein
MDYEAGRTVNTATAGEMDCDTRRCGALGSLNGRPGHWR